MQICGGCFQSQNKSMWLQLYGGHINLLVWHKMKHQNKVGESLVQCHNRVCLNKLLCHSFNYFRYFKSFLSRLSRFWSQSLTTRPKTVNKLLVLPFSFSKCFQLIFPTLSFILVLFATLQPADTEIFYGHVIHILKWGPVHLSHLFWFTICKILEGFRSKIKRTKNHHLGVPI